MKRNGSRNEIKKNFTDNEGKTCTIVSSNADIIGIDIDIIITFPPKSMKLKRILLIMVILVFAIPTKSLASEEIIESAEEMLDISSFISEAQKYTEDVFNDVNFSDILSSAITGDIDETSIAKKIINLLGIEIRQQITMVGSIIMLAVTKFPVIIINANNSGINE